MGMNLVIKLILDSTVLTSVTLSDETIDATALDETIGIIDFIYGVLTTEIKLTSKATINIDASEIDQLLLDAEDTGLTISDQNFVVTDSISVDIANELSEITSGTITASIATDSTVESLKTLTGTNAYTISISSTDADVSAEDLSAIDGKTTERIDAGAVTSISGTYSQISSLLSSNGIYALGAVDLIDDDLSVSQANALDNLTTGSITARYCSARVSDLLRSLSDDNGNNAYTITISEEDATGLTATQLNEINELSSQPVDASAVTALSFDTIANINTLLSSGLDSSQFTETSFSNLSSVSVFDEAGYFEVNTDVANALGTETGVGLNHYINFGQNEGRNDGSIDVIVLNNALNSGYALSPTVVFTLTSGSTIQGEKSLILQSCWIMKMTELFQLSIRI